MGERKGQFGRTKNPFARAIQNTGGRSGSDLGARVNRSQSQSRQYGAERKCCMARFRATVEGVGDYPCRE